MKIYIVVAATGGYTEESGVIQHMWETKGVKRFKLIYYYDEHILEHLVNGQKSWKEHDKEERK